MKGSGGRQTNVEPLCADAGPNSPRSPRFNPLARLFFGKVPLIVARALRERPGEWAPHVIHGELYKLIHIATGTEVWMANRSWGLHIQDRGHRWGDVTPLSVFGLSPGHWLVWAAGRSWGRTRRQRGIDTDALSAALLGGSAGCGSRVAPLSPTDRLEAK